MKVGRFLAFLALLLLGLAGLLVTVCGGGFLLASLASRGGVAIWPIALASLAAGIGVLVFVGLMIKVLYRDDVDEPPRRG